MLLLLNETQLRSTETEFSATGGPSTGIELTVERYENGSRVEGPTSIGSGGVFETGKASRFSVAARPVEPGVLRFVAGWQSPRGTFAITSEVKLPASWSGWNVSFPAPRKPIGTEGEALFAIWDSGSVKPLDVFLSEQITGDGERARGGFVIRARPIGMPPEPKRM